MKFTRTIRSTKYIFGEVKEENGKLEVHETSSFVGTPNMGSRTFAKAKEAHHIPKAALLIATQDVMEKRSMDLDTFLKYSEVVSDDEPKTEAEG
jgi:hypothetical protein